MKKHILLVLTIGFTFSYSASAQIKENAGAMEKRQTTYQQRIKKEYLFGVYIPKDMADAFVQLNKLISQESRLKFKNADEEIATHKLHFSFGRWMIYNWGFYDGSRFSHYLRSVGIYDPDDMAWFIMTTYHRHLNEEALETKQLIEGIQKKRKAMREKRLKKGTVISKTIRKAKKPVEDN